jgi:UDP-N-acetylglucosamine pyrophosphorylase
MGQKGERTSHQQHGTLDITSISSGFSTAACTTQRDQWKPRGKGCLFSLLNIYTQVACLFYKCWIVETVDNMVLILPGDGGLGELTIRLADI